MATRLGEVVDDAQRLAGSFVNSVADSDGKFATNVVATLSTSLAGWADGAIRNSTETSDFDARDLVNPERPTVLILACPGNARRVIAPLSGCSPHKNTARFGCDWGKSARWATPDPCEIYS